MEDFGGISLQEWMRKGEITPSLIEFLQIAIALCNTLDLLYRHRIIHKDIKPANYRFVESIARRLHTSILLDTVKSVEIQIQSYLAQSRFDDSIRIAIAIRIS